MPEQLAEPFSQPQGKKRKQFSPQSEIESASIPPTQGYQQPTIPQLFAATPASVFFRSPRLKTPPSQQPAKRSKPSSSENSPRGRDTGRPAVPLTEATMLNFGSNVVDLTSSPPRASETPATANNVVRSETPARPPAFQPHGGARKLVVKNLRKTPKGDPEAYFKTTWALLDAALTAIFNREKISTSLEELYRGTENICRADRSVALYEKLKARCEQYVSQRLKAEILETAGRSDEELVRAIEAAWSKWGEQLGMIHSIFLYLDRSYLLPSSNMQSIEATGLALFRLHITSDSALEPRFLEGIFALFEYDRENQGEAANISLLLSCIRMISALGLYSSSFEPRFIDVSRKYFARVAEKESVSRDLPGYLKECGDQFERESYRCERFHLDRTTKRSLTAVLEEEMVDKKITILVNQESVGNLLRDHDMVSLATLYTLLNRVGNVAEFLKPAWEKYINMHGSSIVGDTEREAEMVPRLLEFKAALDTIWADSFKRNDPLGYVLREAFGNFINERRPGQSSSNNSKPAEMIAKYVDLVLRTGTKGLPSVAGKAPVEVIGDDDAQLAFQLEQVLVLFRFIHGKDVFEAFYKKDLARRLLLGRSASADAERSMLAKLKTECGAGFTHNLEGMFKDIDLSREVTASFKSSKFGTERSSGVDLYVNVLSQSAWPTYPEIVFNVPQHLAEYLETFRGFYLSKHSGRKLMWRHSLSHCVLKATFPKGLRELVLSGFQAVVLLLFNDIPNGSFLSYSEIRTATGLPDRELNRTLQSIACGRYRVLTKSTKGRDIKETDKFVVNLAFSDAKFRIKINQIQLKETKEENKETHERVAQDRQYETQAAIIRIMKSRKSVRHVELIQATIEQTKNRGVLDINDIKKNIERLIEKDYMERGEKDTYVYVA